MVEDGYFTLSKQEARWVLVTPQGEPFFSIGLNHIDSAALRFSENEHVWNDKYGNSMQRWLTESVRPNLLDWGFNSVGWVQEVVTNNEQSHRHSRSFTYEEYKWLDMPYCHLLPFAEIHQWEVETRHPDLLSKGFAEWCDYVARDQCARMRDDPKPIGYFYSDCPMWVHVREGNAWKGPLFDPGRLTSESGRQELLDLATHYYRVTHDAIRRYDPHHLILGDRYEANALLPEEVVQAAISFVDVLSFQCFGPPERVREKLSHWAELTGKPILLADHAIPREAHSGSQQQKRERYHDPVGYAQTLDVLKSIPEAIGYHLCGAYVCNNVRRRGLLKWDEAPDTIGIEGIREANLGWGV